MLFMVLSVVLQLAAFVIQGFQCWLDARRRNHCPRCRHTRAARPACGQGHKLENKVLRRNRPLWAARSAPMRRGDPGLACGAMVEPAGGAHD
jgi:hypothetical protein